MFEHRDVLFSWLAIDFDFKDSYTVEEQGPTVTLHAYHWFYDVNVLFYTPDNEEKALAMKSYLNTYFSDHKVVLQPVDIQSVFTDIAAIKSKVESVVARYKDKSMDFSMSSGTGIMKVVWYVISTSGKFNSRLIVVLPLRHSSDPDIPDFLVIDVEKTDVPINAVLREVNLNEKGRKHKPLITRSLKDIFNRAYLLSQSDNVSVLILGNTGTGKEVVANYIHTHSARKNKPFLTINCSAFSDQLLESRLFGHRKGAFTGAYSNQKGIFEVADGGTVFLDEIGDISPYMQQALLRFLQFKEIQPIGGRPKRVNTRIIAATNKNITDLITSNKFRTDLFFRLGINIYLPDFKDFTVNEKKQWINYWLDIKRKEFKKRHKLKLSPEVWDFLLAYTYPGNIRELILIIENFYVFAHDLATLEHIPVYTKHSIGAEPLSSLKLEDVEKQHIKMVLKITDGNKSQAAEMLGIVYNTLVKKIEKYGIKL